MRLLQLATPEETFVIDMFEVTDLSPLKEVLEAGPVKAGHNLKFDYQFLHALYGISLSPVFDTMLAAQVLSGGNYAASYSLEAVAERYLDESLDKSEQRSDWSGELSEAQLEYAARDARVLLPLRERLAEALEEEELGRISSIEFAAVATIAEMELAGVKLDVVRWKELEVAVRERRDRAAERLESFFPPPEGVLPLEGLGPRLNLNSPKQITDAFGTLGIELPDTKVWTLLKVDHPAAKALLEYRELQKKLGTYLETYPNFISPKTGRIHANFLQCRVPTGRLACAAPNIQQIPHEDEFRSCFVAEDGNTLVIVGLLPDRASYPGRGLGRPGLRHRLPAGRRPPPPDGRDDVRRPDGGGHQRPALGRQAHKLRPDVRPRGEEPLRPARHGRGARPPAHRRVLRQLPEGPALPAKDGQPRHAGQDAEDPRRTGAQVRQRSRRRRPGRDAPRGDELSNSRLFVRKRTYL